jgi:hypothetical protein
MSNATPLNKTDSAAKEAYETVIRTLVALDRPEGRFMVNGYAVTYSRGEGFRVFRGNSTDEIAHVQGPLIPKSLIPALFRLGVLRPFPGLRLTWTIWTDRHPLTVVNVSPAGKKIVAREDKGELIKKGESTPGGFAAHWHVHPEWKSVEDPNGTERTFTLRGKGNRTVWKLKGHRTASPGNYAVLGVWRYFEDRNF